MTWRFYPGSYAPMEAPLWYFVMQQAGYQQKIVELNQHIPIRAEAFEAGLHSTARRKYRKLREAGFACLQLSEPDWAAVHTFVARARQRQGYPISLSSEALEKLAHTFPQDFLVFEVLSSHAERAAMGVLIRINAQILYHFYPADEEKFLSYSPSILLNGGMYEFGQAQGHTQLDLGISTEQGQLNEGLWYFKHQLGAQNSLKITFGKSLTKS
ncbi:MAG: GNAT family N-acetyltransferase [Microscillaceae bacterium]|nr:GNAT family N-acetyltransferase [Microscillaceae bacterium]